MKNVKRFFAAFLALTMLFSIAIMPVSAADAKSAEAEEPVYVAKMYIAHRSRDYNTNGHTWIYIENLTNGSIQVGAVAVPKGKGVSIGSYGTTIADGAGLYYNVEAWRYRNVDPIDWIHLSKDLTEEDLAKVSNKIVNTNKWSYFLNCAYAAVRIWNAAPGIRLVYLYFPTLMQWQIAVRRDHGNGFQMIKPPLKDVYKQIDNGDTVTTVNTDPTIIEE